MRKLIYLMGTDGAGKTTHATRLAKESINGHEFTYVYCQYVPIILRPLKWLARISIMRGTNQFDDYDSYMDQKKEQSGRLGILTAIYSWVWYVDFLLQAIPKMWYARLRNRHVLIDRYYLDSVVHLGVLQNLNAEQMLQDAHRLERLLPSADVHIMLDVSEEVAFSRKDDIQSVRYLRERKSRYSALGEHYGFLSVDANQDIDDVYSELIDLIKNQLNGTARAPVHEQN